MESISEFVAVEVKEEPIDNKVSSTTQQPSLVDSMSDHSEDPLSQCDEIGIKKEDDVCIKDEPVEDLDPLSTSTTFVPTLKARPRSTRVKSDFASYSKKKRQAVGGPPPTPPKFSEHQHDSTCTKMPTPPSSAASPHPAARGTLQKGDDDFILARCCVMEEEIPEPLLDEGESGSDIDEPLEFTIEVDAVQDDLHDASTWEEEEAHVPEVEDFPPPVVSLIVDKSTVILPVPLPSTSTASSASSLSPSEARSRKRRRGQVHPEEGSPVKKLDVEILSAKDKTVWHRDPNPQLPSIVKTNIEEGAPTVSTLGAKTPGEVLSLFLDDSMLAEVCLHTNDKMQRLRKKLKDPSKATFQDITLMELKACLGILIMSGMRKDNHQSSVEMWSQVCGCPFYRSTMSERRFVFILRCLRFDDSATRQHRLKTDRFAHIRVLWDAVIHHCINNYRPGPHLTVDEQLLAFKGRCVFGMYIPNKPAKYGIKLVMACDSDTHYMCHAMPYFGKGTTVDQEEGTSLGEYFVSELTEPHRRPGRIITADNWFTSLPLARTLQQSNMHLVGSVRPKPYLPQEMLHFNMGIGESVAAFNYEDKVTLLCQRVNATKRMQMLSTVHHNPTVIKNKKTEMQMFYNATKGCVDTFDQMCSATSVSRKTGRWPLCVFYGVINLVLSNSFIVYQHRPENSSVTRRQFGLQLAMELCRPWAHNRLSHHRSLLPRELSSLIESVFGAVEEPPLPELPTKAEKRQRCHICPRSSTARTRVLCGRCRKPTCPAHLMSTCHTCHTA